MTIRQHLAKLWIQNRRNMCGHCPLCDDPLLICAMEPVERRCLACGWEEPKPGMLGPVLVAATAVVAILALAWGIV